MSNFKSLTNTKNTNNEIRGALGTLYKVTGHNGYRCDGQAWKNHKYLQVQG